MYLAKPLIAPTAVAATTTVYYTAPTGTYTRITQFSLTNTDASPRIVNVFIATSSSISTTPLIKSKTLAVNETWVPYQALGVMLAPGYTIQINADSAGVVLANASGIELS